MTGPSDKTSDQIPAVRSERSYRNLTTAQRRAERRGKLLAAALEAFGTRGYNSTSIEQLCADAGVSTRNFYEEFASRGDLMAAVYDEATDDVLNAVVRALGDVDPADLGAQIEAGVGAYFRAMCSDPRRAHVALIESVAVSSGMEARRRVVLNRFASVIASEARRHTDRGDLPELPWHLTAIAIVGALQQLATAWIAEERPVASLEEVIGEASRLVGAALGS